MIFSYHSDFETSEDEDDPSDRDDNNFSSDMLEPIYEGERVTVIGAYCAIMELKRRCRLPFTAIIMILQLLQLLCPLGNKHPTTKHQLMSFFRLYLVSYRRQNFCRTGKSPLQRQVRCCNTACTKQEPNCIIEISPDTALQQIMSGKFKIMKNIDSNTSLSEMNV